MKFHIDENALTISLEGTERFWALQKSLIIPLSAITSMRWASDYEFRSIGTVLRVGGTGWPSMLYAGRFYDFGAKQWIFMYVQKPQGWTLKGGFEAENILEIVTNDFHYSRLIFTAQPDIGKGIESYWSAGAYPVRD